MRSLFLLCLGVVGASASAALINAGFESPLMNPGTFSSAGIIGWTNASGSAGVWNIPSGGFFTVEAPEGTQIGYSNAASIAQQSTDFLGLGTTTLSVMAGRRGDGTAGGFTMQLWAGGSVSAGSVTGGTMLGSATFVHTTIAANSFTPLSVTYVALPGNSFLGQALSVRFVRDSGGQMNFDDVRLTAVVPEPSSFVAFAAAAAILGLRRRK